ncbi:hypothetical protein EWB00_003757 [Schistosoma japonicum]|uniref:Transmembrane protein n=1 Tax=Schistosoma japonicum TaxID=6182 RepID=A0A4Z2DVM2_SCHJA|nr:hypothetical protein KSF78_0009495 [Schistosoma japonicum]TNN20584.1 hypothetical protein EWB00_003757 [Schistosoma japonicum]
MIHSYKMMNKRKHQKINSEPEIKLIEARKPTTKQTLIATIILCSLSILLLLIGISFKLTYGPSLYYHDEYYWLAATGLSLVVISLPIGITSICLLNTLFRIKRYIKYTEARKRMLESQVTEIKAQQMIY